MTAAPTWLAVARHANERIASVLTALETASIEKVPALQAETRVWREVLALPVTLAADTQLDPDPVSYT